MVSKRVVIVGAGPARTALAYLVARRGVEVTLLERHLDFSHPFRGDGLQPSGIDAFNPMGLGEKLMQLPKAIINTIELYQDGALRARIPMERMGFIGCFIPQPAILVMRTDEARAFTGFQLAVARALTRRRCSGCGPRRAARVSSRPGCRERWSLFDDSESGRLTQLTDPQICDFLNCLRNYWRDQRIRPHGSTGQGFAQILDELEDPNSALSKFCDQEHDEHITQRLLEMIRPRFEAKTWLAFQRVALEGVSVDQAAVDLGLSVNAVFIAKSRVLHMLRKAGQGLID